MVRAIAGRIILLVLIAACWIGDAAPEDADMSWLAGCVFFAAYIVVITLDRSGEDK